jgi:hypothetical protein
MDGRIVEVEAENVGAGQGRDTGRPLADEIDSANGAVAQS